MSPPGSNTFDPELFDDGRQLLTTRGGVAPGEVAPWGRRGIYLHQLTHQGWDAGRRLPLPYAWGATPLPGVGLLFVDGGDLRLVTIGNGSHPAQRVPAPPQCCSRPWPVLP